MVRAFAHTFAHVLLSSSCFFPLPTHASVFSRKPFVIPLSSVLVGVASSKEFVVNSLVLLSNELVVTSLVRYGRRKKVQHQADLGHESARFVSICEQQSRLSRTIGIGESSANTLAYSSSTLFWRISCSLFTSNRNVRPHHLRATNTKGQY